MPGDPPYRDVDDSASGDRKDFEFDVLVEQSVEFAYTAYGR